MSVRNWLTILPALLLAACGGQSDVASEEETTGPDASEAVTQSATSGSAYFEENFVSPTNPIVNTTGSPVSPPQAANFGKTPTSFNNHGKWFGDWSPGRTQGALPPLGGVTNYADLNLTVPGTCPTTTGRCLFEAVDNGGPNIKGTYQLGQTTYHSLAVYVPTGGLAIHNAGHNVEIQELHFSNIFNGAAVRVGLFETQVNLWIDTGLCTSGGCQWHTRMDVGAGCPSVTTNCLPATSIIPTGALVPGKWNEIVLGVNWQKTATGSITAWYKAQGSSTWVKSVALTNLATVQYTSTSTPNSVWNDGPEAYGGAVTASTHIYEAGYSDGTSFSSVAATVP